jgi:hypothetical protein
MVTSPRGSVFQMADSAGATPGPTYPDRVIIGGDVLGVLAGPRVWLAHVVERAAVGYVEVLERAQPVRHLACRDGLGAGGHRVAGAGSYPPQLPSRAVGRQMGRWRRSRGMLKTYRRSRPFPGQGSWACGAGMTTAASGGPALTNQPE